MSNMSRRAFMTTSTGLAAMAAGAASPQAVPRVAQAQQTPSKPQEAAKPLLAGVAARDITPQPGIPLWGYSDRKGPATGVLDPLYAKALVLRAGDATAAIVALDLGRAPLGPVCDRIRARAREAGVDFVVFTATHTHHAPAMDVEDAAYIKPVETAIGDSIQEAAGRLEPVRLGVGRAEADVAHNRRVLLEDGRCMMLWRNEEKRPTQPVDKQMGIVRLDRLDGNPLAVLVNFACHPVVMGPSNVQYSADYCGELARIVKEKSGAECLFLQGACGNINPYLDKTPMDKGGLDSMRSVGRTCAEAVLLALPSIKTAASDTPSLRHSERPVVVGARFDLSNPEQTAILKAMYGGAFDKYLGLLTPDLAVPLVVLTLNDALALAFLPGEIFVQYQLELKANSPVRDTFLCGYANEFHAYFPTVRDAAAGGYGGLVATYVGLGAGDKLVMESAIEIGKLSGKLKPIYRPEDFALIESDSA